MCTSLSYRDVSGKVYFGRTLELTVELPYEIVWFPIGYSTISQIEGAAPISFKARHGVLAVTMPCRLPSADKPIGFADLKVLEGMNDAGLTFSLLSYPAAGGGHRSVVATQSVLGASDLGAWVLGQFANVADVKAALADQPVVVQPLAILGGVESPFHYVVHDATGAALVIEFNRGEMSVYDNPVGVMTNGPEFPWHLTNLNNYTFLSNVDTSVANFGGYKAVQPDSGIATAGLPASNTSVGRFVRAAYYAQHTEKAATPDAAVGTLAHILNTFDRARGVTIDYPREGGSHLEVEGLKEEAAASYATEFTSWTSLSDLDRKLFFIRDYTGLNFTRFNLMTLAGLDQPRVIPLKALSPTAPDATAALADAHH
ncbi:MULTISPECIES: linear amide C-N hydrolase [unclassified Chelatococcus]|uniref:linear amide C-N hydrolase n=1 Tax=unclassified Chelatococcus TaxID=2638111 RepID=UPI001BCB6539|nr:MULTISPECIES: linear amide C-N hydrolase [unclassified Chelatococcus]CAH1657094.1 Penicillin amidase [Hyphomicrobiales bacterium]MBS7742358.1 linear amide C-N hydrolase [Chelatococcus sp. HY11]MBX3542524.1 linear amide C-N hydrolase [Chelatococcus sp.]MCO5075259.1 linear amide C-N hydrolase [Chelatococcus sp.]CAH1695958.1 Penicillin amidase [Hyphomicrobiales bacterium]